MLTILSALIGFAGPFVPELLKFFKQKEDNKHELAVLALQAEAAKSAHTYKMDEIGIQADMVEMQTLHQPQQSFGVQILDAAKDWPKFLIVPVFYLFAFLDIISGLVRPVVTFSVVGFYLVYKYALFDMARSTGNIWQQAATMVWNENDLGILFLVLGFYFGARTVKATFGGSSNTGRAGGG